MAVDQGGRASIVAHGVGVRLRQLRQARRLSQEKIALEAGVTQGSISNYETGRYDIPLSVFLAICHALGSTVGEVLQSVEERPLDVRAG